MFMVAYPCWWRFAPPLSAARYIEKLLIMDPIVSRSNPAPEPPDRPYWRYAAYYEDNGRAAEIRNLCIRTMRALHGLSDGSFPGVVDTNDILAACRVQFDDLGIVDRMHVGKPKSFFEGKPVTAAEYFAGQLRALLEPLEQADIPTADTVVPLGGDEEKAIGLVELRGNPAGREFLRRITMVFTIAFELDAEAEVFSV